MPILEELAYGIARGALRAWLEYRATLLEVEEERPSEESKKRAAAFRAAVIRMSTPEAPDTGRKSSASTSEASRGSNPS